MKRESGLNNEASIELSEQRAIAPWFGFARSEATATPRTGRPEDRVPVTVQEVPEGVWSDEHVERLLSTAPREGRDTNGLVPVVSVTTDSDELREVVSLRTDAPRFQERLDFRTPPPWNEGAGVALAAAIAVEKGHSLGLRHGALNPEDVVVAGSEIAVSGMGLSLGGIPDSGTFIAPEVAASGVPTVPGDVYSLGRLLEAGTVGDPNTPAAVLEVITDATAPDVDDRIPSALAFADRLREAGGGIMRDYTPMAFGASPLFAPEPEPIVDTTAPVAAAPIDKPPTSVVEEEDEGRSKVLPWLVGAGLAGVVGFGLWAAATSGGSDGASTTTTVTTISTTTEAPTTTGSTTTVLTTTEGPTTTASTTTTTPTTTGGPTTTASTTTESPDTTPSTTDGSSTTEAPTTTEAPSTTTETTTPETTTPETTTTEATTTTESTTTTDPDSTATPASNAGLEFVHGLSEPAVDAYVNGELLVAGFEPGQIAGPVALDADTYDVQLFAQSDNPPQTASDRDDEPLASEAVRVSGQPETIVVSSNADGVVALTPFAEDLTPLAAGTGRISLRNPTDSTILVRLDPEPFMEGEAIERQAIAPGAVFSRDLPAGDYRLFLSQEDGSSLLATVISNPEGEVTSGTFLHNGPERLILQRIDGLGTPPDGIPTGTGGLLPGSGDPLPGLLLAAAGSMGLFILVGRERFRRS